MGGAAKSCPWPFPRPLPCCCCGWSPCHAFWFPRCLDREGLRFLVRGLFGLCCCHEEWSQDCICPCCPWWECCWDCLYSGGTNARSAHWAHSTPHFQHLGNVPFITTWHVVHLHDGFFCCAIARRMIFKKVKSLEWCTERVRWIFANRVASRVRFPVLCRYQSNLARALNLRWYLRCVDIAVVLNKDEEPEEHKDLPQKCSTGWHTQQRSGRSRKRSPNTQVELHKVQCPITVW